jgi:hypothetical protein
MPSPARTAAATAAAAAAAEAAFAASPQQAHAAQAAHELPDAVVQERHLCGGGVRGGDAGRTRSGGGGCGGVRQLIRTLVFLPCARASACSRGEDWQAWLNPCVAAAPPSQLHEGHPQRRSSRGGAFSAATSTACSSRGCGGSSRSRGLLLLALPAQHGSRGSHRHLDKAQGGQTLPPPHQVRHHRLHSPHGLLLAGKRDEAAQARRSHPHQLRWVRCAEGSVHAIYRCGEVAEGRRLQ